MVKGSQNALTNVSERIQIRKGYALDGAVSSVNAPILASFDWLTRNNGEKHIRAGFLTSAGNDGKLQYRYADSIGAVTWRDLISSLTTVAYNFTTFWNTTENLRECLFVNGTSSIYRWNGATATFASATSNTLTLQGSTSWLDSGFYSSLSGRSIVIGGVTATYSGGESTTTLTGVSVDFSATAVGAVIHQGVVTTANSAMTGITSTFSNGLISVLNNQVFVAALNSSVLWISKVNSFTDYSNSTPRQSGEGASLILDSQLVALIPQENYMYVSAGLDRWYNVNFSLQTSTVGVTYEQVNALPLKTGPLQGAMSQASTSHMKNNIIMISNEVTIDLFGRIEDYFGTPQTKNISDPIKNDIDSYDFTDASIGYHRFYIYVAIPKEELVLVYNIATSSWESPQTIPVSRFYIVDGELYGHSYLTSESYQLFTGYADRVYPGFAGFPIDFKAYFSYQNYGTRSYPKAANAFYIEGYINANTTINARFVREIDGCETQYATTISGMDGQIVCIARDTGSLGKASLGKQKLGGSFAASIQGLPPKFRVIKTFTNVNFYECQMQFEILGVDQRCEFLAFGTNATPAKEGAVSIRQ